MKINPFVRKFSIVFLFSFCFWFNLSAQTNEFRIIGYVPNWIDVNTFAQNFDYKQVTHLNFSFQNPDVSGNLNSSNTGLTTLVSKAHQNKVKVLVSIGGGSAANDPVKTDFLNLITTAEKRAAYITKILAYLNRFQLDGLDVDEEGPAINSNYGAFIKQLADSLKPKKLLLTAAVGWGGENIPNSAFQYFDFITLMSYDLTGTWDLNNPGQHSPYWYAEKMINDYKKRGVKKEQICLGVPFYGYGFYKKSGYLPYNEILTKYPDAWSKDQVGDTIYYNGMNTIWKKTKLAIAECSGVMIWELSLDSKNDKSLLNVISTTVDSLKTTGVTGFSNQKSNFKMYPNPAENEIFIEVPLNSVKKRIKIYAINGCLVKSLNINNSNEAKLSIDISDLISGTYICSLSTDKSSFSNNFFIKQTD
jgi:GH18 family chitinase